MDKLINLSKKYAINLHNKRGYTYGNNQPYSYHLEMVVTEIKKRLSLIKNEDERIIVECAGWLHDTVEDCGISPNDIINELGYISIDLVYKIAQVVVDVSDVPGMNRVERALLTYPKIRKNDLAVFLKMCDRYANVYYSKEEKHRMWDGYKKQYPLFRYSLKPSKSNDPFLSFWNELDELHEYYITTPQEIIDEMDSDMEDSGMSQGEIESCLNHWKNKYLITKK